MKRLTVHLSNVPRVEHQGKIKLFNTVTFRVKTGSKEEVEQIIGGLSNVKSHYVSNVN